MLVSDVINDARYSELQQLSLKDDDAAVLTYINMGLLELYKRFNLRMEEAIVTLSENQTVYTLDPANNYVTMPSDCDLMAIIGVFGEDAEQIEINDEEDILSVLTPAYDTIQVPNPADNSFISVIYSASPTRLTATTDKLKIPPSLYEALLQYIGYRAHASVDATANTENNMHYLRFEKSCDTARTYGLVTADDIKSRAVTSKGFL